jgi:hypothetical protein
MLDQRPREEDTMAVPEPHDGPTADKDRDWNWSEQGARQVDAMLEKGGYKLPHHELIDGRLQVVWRGVTHAMNVLAGGRGGVDIHDKDRRAVWRHLARHYEQFDEEPPELS